MIKNTVSTVLVLLLIASTLSFFQEPSITGMVANEIQENDDVQISVGEIFVQHSKEVELVGLKDFYENVLSFSEDVVNICSMSENKDDCVTQKMLGANNSNLNVTSCKDPVHFESINLSKLALDVAEYKQFLRDSQIGGLLTRDRTVTDYLIKIKGLVLNVDTYTSISPSAHKIIRSLELEQLNGEILIISFDHSVNDMMSDRARATLINISESEGKYLELVGYPQDVFDNSITMSMAESVTNRPWADAYKINPSYFFEHVLKEVALSIGNCAVSLNDSCLCIVDFPFTGEVLFSNGLLTYQNNSVGVPVNFFGRDISVTDRIVRYVPSESSHDLDFSLGGLLYGSVDETVEYVNYVEIDPAILSSGQKISFTLFDDSKRIVFKKETVDGKPEFIVVGSTFEPELFQGLQECVIDVKHYLFCVEPLVFGETVLQKRYSPSLKFALKI